ncbi:unnamed protein product [Closterium sp. NIES-53]
MVSHLRTSDARYCATVPAELLDRNQPPMFITIYFIVTRLPDSLRSVWDQFLFLVPTSLTVDLLEQHLLAAETSAVAVGAARGTPRPPFFEGCSLSPLPPPTPLLLLQAYLLLRTSGLLLLVRSAATARARVAGVVEVAAVVVEVAAGVVVGAAVEVVEAVEVVAAVGLVAGVGALVAAVEAAVGVAAVEAVGLVAIGLDLGVEALVVASGSSSSDRARPSLPSGSTCGKLHTQHRCFSRLDDAWRAEFGDEVERPRWVDLLRYGVAIFDLDFDVILFAMYALTASAEGDCYRCVPSDPGIAAAALGASESGTLPGTAPTESLHTFTLDSSTSRCFFRDSTTLTPLPAPVLVRLADPSGGPVIARSSTVLPCPAVPSGSLLGLHLPSFSMNLVSSAALQDAMVTTTTPGGQRVPICTCTRTGRHLATFTRRPGSSLYTLTTEPPQNLLWHRRLGHPSLPRLRGMHSRLLVSGLPRSLPPLPPSPAPPCLPCVEGRQCAAPHSSSFPPTTAPLKTLHMDVWVPARVSGQGREHYFLLVVDDYMRYTTVFPLRNKGEVVDVLIPWIRVVRLQLRKRFCADLPVLRLHSDRGGEFSSNLLRDFCRGEGILQSFTLPDSPQQNGIAERRIGLVMEVARTSMIHAVAPHFPWSFAVRCDAHQLNLWPHVFLPETSPTLHWTGKVGDASVFRVWGSRAFVRDTSADKLSARAIPYVFLGFVPDALGGRSYHPTSRRGSEPGGAETRGGEPRGAETRGGGPGGAEPEGVEPQGAEPEGAESGGAEPEGAALSGGPDGASPRLSPQQLPRGGGVPDGAGVPGGTAATGPGGARTQGARAGDPTKSVAAGARGSGAGGAGAGGVGQVLGVPSSTGLIPPLLCPPPDQSQSSLHPASPLPAPSPYTEQSGDLTERCVSHPRPPPVPRTQAMTLRPSSVPPRVPLPAPPESSLPEVPDLESDPAHATSPTVSRLLATVVTDPSFESATASALVDELLDFAAACRLDYATALVAESASASPPSVGGECALGTDVFEDRQEDFECLAAAVPRFASMLLAPEGDLDAPDISTSRSYADAITGPYSSQWQAAMDAEMASWKSTGTYVDEVSPPGANIVNVMWIFRVKRPPGSPPAFKACYVARGSSLRQGVDYFHTFSLIPKMTTLQVLLHVAAQRDYEVHSLDFSTAFLQGSLHEEIWMRRPPGFTGSFSAGTQPTLAALGFAPSTADQSLFLRTETLLPPFYVLVYIDDLDFATPDTEALTLVKSKLQKRQTCIDQGELRSYLGLQITWDRARRTITLTQSHMVHQVLQRFGFQFSSPQTTPFSTSHFLSVPPSDESAEPSGPFPELVGCLMYLITCTRPDLAYPLSLLARYVAPGRHRKVHWDAAKRVLRYLCSTSGMGLVLGGRGPVVLTGHADASWVDNLAMHRLSQGYTFSLGSNSVSWRSTRPSSIFSSSCEAEIYAGAMAAQELRWLTYLLTDLGEQSRLPPVLYIDNKAMIAL